MFGKRSRAPADGAEFDYVIIGAGSAGGVLVNRLSENATVQVLLIEAGGDRYGLHHRIPAGSIRMMGNPAYDWMNRAEPDASADGRSIHWPAGKGLGGSSLINGMVYIRGSRRDYDDWNCPGWRFDDVLPFFRKMETYDGRASGWHGKDGPVGVSRPRGPHPATEAFLRAAAEIGIPTRDDYCDGDIEGAFEVLGTIRNGMRSSTRVAYINEARRRRNVTVVTGALAERLLIEEGRAVGVRVKRDGRVEEFRARGEVIVSCGAVQSPLLLMRSGIGPAEELKALGITPLRDIPAVGRNLQDHLGTGSARRTTIPSYNVQTGPFNMLSHAGRFLLSRSGPLASAAGQAQAYFKSDPALDEPDLGFAFMPLLITYTDMTPSLPDIAGVTIGTIVCKPEARGRVRLRDARTESKPVIEFPMLADPRDLARLVAGLKMAERMWSTRALSPLIAGELIAMPQDAAGLEAYVRSTCGIAYHASGTCRMGLDGNAVLDPLLRVRGVDGLRVVDLSIVPRIVSGNTNAAAIMIGERGADLIKGARAG